MKHYSKWILAGVGLFVSVAGPAWVVWQQLALRPPGQTLVVGYASLWPLPGLVLLIWTLLGVVAFLGITLGPRRQFAFPQATAAHKPDKSFSAPDGTRGTWSALGAFIPMMILGAASIGPLVLINTLAFGAAAVLADWRTRSVRTGLALCAAGAGVNFVLLWLLITM